MLYPYFVYGSSVSLNRYCLMYWYEEDRVRWVVTDVIAFVCGLKGLAASMGTVTDAENDCNHRAVSSGNVCLFQPVHPVSPMLHSTFCWSLSKHKAQELHMLTGHTPAYYTHHVMLDSGKQSSRP